MGHDPDWDIPIEEFKWRVQRVPKNNPEKGIYVAYPDARTVAHHLDRIFGPMNWKDDYEIDSTENGVICHLSVRENADSEWITKTDVGAMTQIESLKGGFSDAFKRAAAKLGVGRNVYALPEIWAEVNQGKFMPYKDKKGRPFSVYLAELANAKIGKEPPVGDYEADQPVYEEPEKKAEKKPAQEPLPKKAHEVSDEEWGDFTKRLGELSNERKERVKKFWKSVGSTDAPTRSIKADEFEQLLMYVTGEMLEQEGLTTGGEAFDEVTDG